MNNNEINIRGMIEDDIQDVVSLDNQVFPSRSYNYKEELANPDARCFVAVDNDRVVGMASFRFVGSIINLLTIGVVKEYQHKGIGSKLLAYIIDNCESGIILLQVRKSNKVAQFLYNKFGFTLIKEKDNYYSDKETALIYGRRIKVVAN